jgi:hypothetical protein
VVAKAQQPAKIPRIGILASASESSTPPFKPLQLGSRDSSEIKTLQRGALPLPHKIVTFCPSCNGEHERLDFPKT